ncbi:MAG: hypothetical protein ACTSO9_16020 [Candidatus Helarchaeota archaeon]
MTIKKLDLSKYNIKPISSRELNKLLVVWNPDNHPNIKVEVVRKFLKNHSLNTLEIKTDSVFKANKRIIKESDHLNTDNILIIGDNIQFPSLNFNHKKSLAFTDILFEQIDEFYLRVGRIYGGEKTIQNHIRFNYGDSNLAVVVDTTPKRSEMPVKALESLDFKVFMWSGINGQSLKIMEPLLEKAEMILQYSDGTFFDRVHGNPKEWYGGNPPKAFFTYKDFRKIQFKCYPFIFSEACNTASFGPFVREAIKAMSVYLGATSLTYNNKEEYENWENCHYCDGVKYGILDLLEKKKNLGEVKLTVDKILFETLPASKQRIIKSLTKKNGVDIKNPEVVSTIQWILFGNPLRPVTVGVKPSFKITKIPVYMD